MSRLEDIIVKPLITEKASVLTRDVNTYTFQVELHANKNQIKRAVEQLFNVDVASINTTITSGKVKRSGRGVKKGRSVKRAYVQLKAEQKIEFFKGV